MRSARLVTGELSPALVIAPHPDDETFGCGGTLALMTHGGGSVHVAFVTDGGASHPSHEVVTQSEIAERRRVEAGVAASILGIDSARIAFLGAPDGGLAELEGEPLRNLVAGLAGTLSRVMPKAVLLPCRSDGSSEHNAAFRIVQRALEVTGQKPRILEFPVWSWWNPILLFRSMFAYSKVWRVELADAQEVKSRAAAAYASQLLPIPPDPTPALPQGFSSMFIRKEEFFLEK